MAHPRKLIRQAVVTLLVAANTAAGARVRGTRVEPHKKSQLPAIGVYTLSDPVDEDTSTDREDKHDLEVEIAGWVAHTDALPVDDAMDDLAEQIETAMRSDPWLNGKVGADGIRLLGTVMEVVEDHGRSDPLIGIVVLTYAVPYFVDLTAVDPTDLFLRASATHQLEGGAADTAPAIDEFQVTPWELDATSAKGVPATLAQWAKVFDSILITTRMPSYGWGFQDASGDAAAAFGGLVLGAQASPAYQQPISGWTRDACAWSDGDNDRFGIFTSIPNLLTNSFAALGYIFTTNTPAAEREIMGMGAATVSQIKATTGGKYRIVNSAGVGATGAVSYGAGVRPLLHVYNRALSTLKLYTDAEIISVAYGVISGGGVWYGGQTTLAPNGGVLFGAAWTGLAAEFTDAEVRDLLTALGWTVAW